MTQDHNVKWNEQEANGYILYDDIYMTSHKRAKTIDREKKINVC